MGVEVVLPDPVLWGWKLFFLIQYYGGGSCSSRSSIMGVEVVLPDPVLWGWKLFFLIPYYGGGNYLHTMNTYHYEKTWKMKLMYTRSLKFVLGHQQNATPDSAANTNIHVYHFVNVNETVLRFKREPVD